METEVLIRIIIHLITTIFIMIIMYTSTDSSKRYLRLVQSYTELCNHLARIHIDNIERMIASLPPDFYKNDEKLKELKEISEKALKQAKETIDLLEKE
jgi:hypothetical protein